MNESNERQNTGYGGLSSLLPTLGVAGLIALLALCCGVLHGGF